MEEKVLHHKQDMDLKNENELNIEGKVIKTELPEISSNASEAQINFNEEIQNKTLWTS